MNKFKVGDIVVCRDFSGGSGPSLERDCHYVVTRIEPCGNHPRGPLLHLRGLDGSLRALDGSRLDIGFFSSRFEYAPISYSSEMGLEEIIEGQELYRNLNGGIK